MDKKAFMHPLALAGALAAAGPGWAQSSVTISGFLDAGVYRDYDAGPGGNRTKVGSISRSNLAFSGVEDLGGGLATTFRLSTRFNMGTGAPESRAFFHGESTVGLKGSFGSIRAGRALTAMWDADWNFDPWYNFDAIASPAWYLWHGNSPSDPNSRLGGPPGTTGIRAEYARLNSGVFYTSPTLAGFTFSLSQGVDRNPEDRARNTSAVLNYAAGPFSAMLAVERNPARNVNTFAAAKYDFKVLQLMGAYDHEKPASGSGAVKNRSITLGAAVPVQATTFNLGYGRQLDYDANFFSAGVVQVLSKRTNVYLSAGHKGKGLWGASTSSTAYGVGINHSF